MMSGVKSLTVKKRNVIFLDSLQGMREKSTVYLPDALLLFFPFQGGRLVLAPGNYYFTFCLYEFDYFRYHM